jgi:hypothetical protein
MLFKKRLILFEWTRRSPVLSAVPPKADIPQRDKRRKFDAWMLKITLDQQ